MRQADKKAATSSILANKERAKDKSPLHLARPFLGLGAGITVQR